jgi:hypothetical protein
MRQQNHRADPTRQEYRAFAGAFDHFNRELFGGGLPHCYVTLQRRAHTYGYYSHERFGSRGGDGRTDEIVLNPAHFVGRSDAEILSTLVHEMVHEWQAHFGKPGRGRYHNREWADRMEGLGLMPSSTGAAGGRRTGQRVSHYIIGGGRFDLSCQRLLEGGFRLNWQSCDPSANGRGPDTSKKKFTCPACLQNAWAKSGASLLCGLCGEVMVGVDGAHGPCPAYRTTDTPELAALPFGANGARVSGGDW